MVHASHDHQIFIADSGCDQTLVTNIWRVLANTGRYVCMTGAFAGRSAGELFPVVSAICKVVLPDGRALALVGHEVLLDSNPHQVESLLSIHQSLRLRVNRIDDRPVFERDVRGLPGTQKAVFDKYELPFYFDGSKCFFELSPISEEEMVLLPRVTITPEGPYEPTHRSFTRRSTGTASGPSLQRWRECLGYCPVEIVSKTLTATTQLVPTVEAETREIMRDHLLTRLPVLIFIRDSSTLTNRDCW